jgi:zinc and cadmium transporter
MSVLAWIITGGLLMAIIALFGSITLLLKKETLDKLLLPLVAFAAGTLIGGAFFHLLPSTLEAMSPVRTFTYVLIGFTVFFALEQFLHWHHCQRAETNCKRPVTYLILIGDGLHNFLGGLAIAGTFLIDIRLGITSWLAAAAHELPQELGDMGVLVHGGWSKSQALLFNVISALTFLIGGLIAYFASFRIDILFLVPFAAGNFMYIGATDLIPELTRHSDTSTNIIHLVMFIMGVLLMYFARLIY